MNLSIRNWYIIILGACFIITVTLNIVYNKSLTSLEHVSKSTVFDHAAVKDSYSKMKRKFSLSQPQQQNQQHHRQEFQKEAETKTQIGLSCDRYGGPSDEIAEEMIYWSDIQSDSRYVSPFHQENNEKYLTFEPDGGGWNNIRMAMETVVALAFSMGRTLVMPPDQRMYLLGDKKRGATQKVHFSFADFFDFDLLAAEHKGLKIITMEEFLQRTAMKGKLFDKQTGQPKFPPNNRTDWNGRALHENELHEYLRSVTNTPIWRPNICLAAFPKSSNSDGMRNLHDSLSNILSEKGGRKFPHPEDYIGKPTPVDASTEERLREALAGRKELCIYDEEMQKSLVVHFMCKPKEHARLLTHFYSFLFFEDWRQDLWMKRFVRDHLKYLDELQCTAARVINAIRERARANDPLNNPTGLYDSFHVRRGEFQYKRTRIEADQIYENSKDKLVEGGTVFISTDERKQEFFAALGDHYDICFLSDFKHLFPDINTNYYGILDQLIASRARVFLGTFHSTFTGYINRMRGYYAERHKLKGHQNGTIESYYFVPILQKEAMKTYMPIKGSFFNREFPVSWRDIDHGIENEILNFTQS